MILHQGNKSIEFTIVNYQYPEKSPSKEGFDYDANWLMCEVKYSDAKTNETYKDACLLTDELADMVEELSEILDGSEDGYISDFMEPYLKVAAARADEKIVIKSTSGFCPVDYAYSDKLTIMPNSIAYEYKPYLEDDNSLND